MNATAAHDARRTLALEKVAPYPHSVRRGRPLSETIAAEPTPSETVSPEA